MRRRQTLGPRPDWWDVEGHLIWDTPDDTADLAELAARFQAPEDGLKGRLAAWVALGLLDVLPGGRYALKPLANQPNAPLV